MKQSKLLVFTALFGAFSAGAQTWQSVNYPGGFINTADTFQNKLYLAGGGFVQSYDGTNWGELTNYNNSLNTPNKSKYAARNIDNVLYMGARDFNTNGEGIIHTYDGTNITEKQAFRQFQYNGNKKIIDFVKVNNAVYTSDGYSILEWRDTSTFWRTLYTSQNITGLESFNNRLVFHKSNELYFMDSTGALDSAGFSNITFGTGKMFGSVTALCKRGNTLYACGNFTKIIDSATAQFESGNIMKFDGSSYTFLAANFGTPPTNMTMATIGRLFVDVNDDIYAICKKDPSVNDVHLIRYSNSQWSTVSKLVSAGQGLYPTIPGSELYDYNKIFRYGNDIFVAGRFIRINGDSIPNLARLDLGSTGVKAVESTNGFAAFPNPVNDKISFNLEPGTMAVLSIFDIAGRNVLTAKVQHGDADLSVLRTGIYAYVLRLDDGKTITGKIRKD